MYLGAKNHRGRRDHRDLLRYCIKSPTLKQIKAEISQKIQEIIIS
jgi:hypothetical protein